MTKDLPASYYQLNHALADLREHLTVIEGYRWLTARGDGDPNIDLGLGVIKSAMGDLTLSIRWLIEYTGGGIEITKEDLEHEKAKQSKGK